MLGKPAAEDKKSTEIQFMPWSTMLVTEILKVGLVVPEWARRKELISSAF
ncbi:hypothetical protein IFM89_006917, partial [Coptis chinensis]